MLGRFNPESLQTRSVSAAILIPAVLAVLYFGGWPFVLFLMLLAGLSLYEWIDMSFKCQADQHKYGAIVFGLVYILGCVTCFYLLPVTIGFYWTVAFLFMLWGSDTGGYVFGKAFGGPKMAKTISPNKTWAGFGGAVLTPAVLGAIAMFIYTGVDGFSVVGIVMMSIAGLCVGVAGQAGDLLVSVLKRKAGVKDTGKLIPGHGGLLDRIDSLLMAAPVFLLLHYVGHGV